MQCYNKRNLLKLGKRIKLLREKTGKSLNGLVLEKGGVTCATWSRIENGKVDVKFNTLLKIASVLDVKIDELIFGIEFDYSIDDD